MTNNTSIHEKTQENHTSDLTNQLDVDSQTSIHDTAQKMKYQAEAESVDRPHGFLLISSGAPELRLKKQSAEKYGPAVFLSAGWAFRDRDAAEKCATEKTNGKRTCNVVPWFDKRLDEIWNGSKAEASNARKSIKNELDNLKNCARIRDIEIECDRSGLHYSFLHADSPLDELDDKEKSIFNHYKPLWEEARREAEIIQIREQDNKQEKDDLETIPETKEDAIVEELNRKHAFVHTDASHILTEKPHSFLQGVMDFVLESRQSLINSYENQKVEGKNTKAHVWLSHPKRRSFPNGITFDPSTPEHRNGFYNLWGGFAYSPKQGSCELFKSHIQHVICSRNFSYFEYVWKWCAYVFQYPDRVHTALLLMGSQGTGKGVFVKALGALFGKHFIHLDSVERLVGNFNFHMKNAVLVFADEAVWGGNRKDVGRLKAMITEELALIEPKGKDSIAIRNFRHFIFSSNEDWPVHLDRDDRRFFVLKVSDSHKEDFSYFASIAEELKHGGYEALLYELLDTDVRDFDPRKMPSNIDSFSVKLKSASTSEQYLFEALNAGCFDVGNTSPSSEFPNGTVLKSSIYTDYSCWCARQGIKPEMQENFSKALLRTIPSSSAGQSRQFSDNKSRKPTYTFPTLEVARKEFEKTYKAGPEIWE